MLPSTLAAAMWRSSPVATSWNIEMPTLSLVGFAIVLLIVNAVGGVGRRWSRGFDRLQVGGGRARPGFPSVALSRCPPPSWTLTYRSPTRVVSTHALTMTNQCQDLNHACLASAAAASKTSTNMPSSLSSLISNLPPVIPFSSSSAAFISGESYRFCSISHRRRASTTRPPSSPPGWGRHLP